MTALQTILSYTYALVVATCAFLVVWQGSQSIQKYIEKPQTTLFSVEKFWDQKVLPVVTICPTDFLTTYANDQALAECGL